MIATPPLTPTINKMTDDLKRFSVSDESNPSFNFTLSAGSTGTKDQHPERTSTPANSDKTNTTKGVRTAPGRLDQVTTRSGRNVKLTPNLQVDPKRKSYRLEPSTGIRTWERKKDDTNKASTPRTPTKK